MFFVENQCYFCPQTDNLIQMSTNSLIIDSMYIDFAQLIRELFQIKVRFRYLIFGINFKI